MKNKQLYIKLLILADLIDDTVLELAHETTYRQQLKERVNNFNSFIKSKLGKDINILFDSSAGDSIELLKEKINYIFSNSLK